MKMLISALIPIPGMYRQLRSWLRDHSHASRQLSHFASPVSSSRPPMFMQQPVRKAIMGFLEYIPHRSGPLWIGWDR